LHTLEAQVTQLAAGVGQADTLQQALQALGDPRQAYTLAKSQADRRPALDVRRQAAQTQQASLQAVLAGLAAQLQEYAGLDAELAAVKTETQRTQPAYTAVLANGRLAATLDNRIVDATARAAELAQVQQEAALNAAQLADAESRFDSDAFLAATALDQQLRLDLGALQNELDMLGRAQAQEQAEVEVLVAMKATLSEQEGRSGALKAQEEGLETIRTLLRDAGPHITKVLVRRISENARQIYSELMQDYTRHLTWHEDYGITLEVDGYVRQFAQLSGGEQMSAALAVRLALLRDLTNIDVAFFDEPTANLDGERRDALARQILQVKGFRQLFVISHDDTFEQATQNLIRVERVGGISRVEYG
jgi:exonuclease SbcC